MTAAPITSAGRSGHGALGIASLLKRTHISLWIGRDKYPHAFNRKSLTNRFEDGLRTSFLLGDLTFFVVMRKPARDSDSTPADRIWKIPVCWVVARLKGPRYGEDLPEQWPEQIATSREGHRDAFAKPVLRNTYPESRESAKWH